MGHNARHINLIVGHHSASAPTWTWQNTVKFHQKKFKMYMGYHRSVARDGFVFDGRRIQYRGAHAPPNANRLGIVAIGWNGHSKHPDWAWTEEQWKSLLFEFTYWSERFPLAKICGHNQTKATLCPGVNLGEELIKRGFAFPERILVGRVF